MKRSSKDEIPSLQIIGRTLALHPIDADISKMRIKSLITLRIQVAITLSGVSRIIINNYSEDLGDIE